MQGTCCTLPGKEVVILRAREGTGMMALLVGFLADLVFSAASSTGGSYRTELNRYMTERGFAPRTGPARPPSR